jgi:hypothetical protein
MVAAILFCHVSELLDGSGTLLEPPKGQFIGRPFDAIVA